MEIFKPVACSFSGRWFDWTIYSILRCKTTCVYVIAEPWVPDNEVKHITQNTVIIRELTRTLHRVSGLHFRGY